MNRVRVCVAGLAFLTFFAAMPALGADQVLSLGRAVELALKQTPTLEAARQAVAQAEGRLTQTTSRWWPQLSGAAGYSRNYTEKTRNTSTYSGHYDYYDTGLVLSQKIYDFGQTGGRVEASRQELSAVRHDLSTQREAVVLAVKVTYFEVLKNQRLVTVASKTLESQQRHLEQAKGFYATGLRPKIDVARATLDMANARLALISAQYSQREARVAMERVLGGRPWKTPYELAPEKEMPPLPGNLEPLLVEALKQRPETASLKASVAAAPGLPGIGPGRLLALPGRQRRLYLQQQRLPPGQRLGGRGEPELGPVLRFSHPGPGERGPRPDPPAPGPAQGAGAGHRRGGGAGLAGAARDQGAHRGGPDRPGRSHGELPSGPGAL